MLGAKHEEINASCKEDTLATAKDWALICPSKIPDARINLLIV